MSFVYFLGGLIYKGKLAFNWRSLELAPTNTVFASEVISQFCESVFQLLRSLLVRGRATTFLSPGFSGTSSNPRSTTTGLVWECWIYCIRPSHTHIMCQFETMLLPKNKRSRLEVGEGAVKVEEDLSKLDW